MSQCACNGTMPNVCTKTIQKVLLLSSMLLICMGFYNNCDAVCKKSGKDAEM